MSSQKTDLGRSGLGVKSTSSFLGLLVTLLFAGCQAQVSTATLPAPAVWRVQATPSMRWLGPIFNQCTLQAPQVSLLFTELPQPALDPSQVDFTFSFEPAPGADYSAFLGQVELTVVVNPSNPITLLAATELRSIFSGNTSNWTDLPAADCPGCARPLTGPIRPYIYSAGDDAGLVFNDLFPGLPPKLVDAILAPGPQAIRQAVASDLQGIGYLPATWLDSSVHSVKITGLLENKLQFPIILSASAEPEGMKRSWVLCVQDNLNK